MEFIHCGADIRPTESEPSTKACAAECRADADMDEMCPLPRDACDDMVMKCEGHDGLDERLISLLRCGR